MPSAQPKSSPGFRESPRSRVTKSVQAWIRDGVLPLGERLPAERVLAEQLGVSRVTVRSVLQQLETEGLIRAIDGGARVVARLGSESTTTMSNAVVIVGEPIRQEELTGHVWPAGYEVSVQIGAMGAVQASGRSVLVLHADRLADAGAASRLAREGPVGVIFISRTPRRGTHMQSAEVLVAAGVPVVAYGYEEEFPGLDTVGSDQETGAYELARWLIACGRQRILCLSPRPEDGDFPAWYKRRRAGYERAMREAGLEQLPIVMAEPTQPADSEERWSEETKARVTAGYLVEYLAGPKPPDAIMAPSDGPANTVSAALRLFGKTPGRDILVTGYDNYWAALAERGPVSPAATVDKLNAECGQAIVDLLLERAARKLPLGKPEHRLSAPRLVVLERPAEQPKV